MPSFVPLKVSHGWAARLDCSKGLTSLIRYWIFHTDIRNNELYYNLKDKMLSKRYILSTLSANFILKFDEAYATNVYTHWKYFYIKQNRITVGSIIKLCNSVTTKFTFYTFVYFCMSAFAKNSFARWFLWLNWANNLWKKFQQHWNSLFGLNNLRIILLPKSLYMN